MACPPPAGEGAFTAQGNMVWLLGSVIPVALPSLEACLRELTQIVWGRKGAQMHLCWELLGLCWSEQRAAPLCSWGDQGGNPGAEEQGQRGEGDRHCVRAKGWLVWKGS